MKPKPVTAWLRLERLERGGIRDSQMVLRSLHRQSCKDAEQLIGIKQYELNGPMVPDGFAGFGKDG